MLPEGFILRMQSLLGEEYAAFSASFDRPLCTGLRLNPLKTRQLLPKRATVN